MALGPVALVLLAVTVSAALARKRLKRVWRWLHRLNYLLFVVALAHAFKLGFDLKYGAGKTFTQVVALSYASLAAAAVAIQVEHGGRSGREAARAGAACLRLTRARPRPFRG